MAFDVHQHMLDNVNGLNAGRRQRGLTPISKAEIARRAKISLRHLNRIYAGDACTEATWQKLIDAVIDSSSSTLD